MQLPPNFGTILQAGIAGLRQVEAILEREIATRPEIPELALQLRDASGLLTRFDMTVDAEPEYGWWQAGHATLNFAPQDIGVLKEFSRVLQEKSPYRPDGVDANQRAVSELATLLEQYLNGDFEHPRT